MERIEANVTGKVQMVMFRDFAKRKADTLGLFGEVRNLSDGSVSVIAEGEKDQLEEFIKKLRKGPLFSRVESVAVSWYPATGNYSEFTLVLGKSDTV